MKQLTCEMCGSTDLMKQDGVFVCQSCGCKYSVEEAKKMMVEGTVEVQGTVRVDNTAQIQTFLELSQNAYASKNGQSAFDYANKALEIAPQNPQAWIAKMKAVEYIATLGDPKLMEMLEAGKNAIKYAPDATKDDIELEVYTYQLRRSLDFLAVATYHMSDTDDIKNTYNRFLAISFLTATDNTLQADQKIVNLYDKPAHSAIQIVLSIPNESLAKFTTLIDLALQCADYYNNETKALKNRYQIYGASLSDSAMAIRNENINKIREKIWKAKDIQDNHRQQYWAEHKEEREQLEAEQGKLYTEKDELEKQIDALTGLVHTMQRQVQESKEVISNLRTQKDAILFKKSAKEALQAQIDAKGKELAELEKSIQKDEQAHAQEIEQCRARIGEINQRIAEIQAEFDKDR